MIVAAASSSPATTGAALPIAPRFHTSTTSAAASRNVALTSVRTYCSISSWSGSNSTGTVASAASQRRLPKWTRTA